MNPFNKEELVQLRLRFDQRTKRKGLSRTTATRYRNWIRRYVQYCRAIGVHHGGDTIISFLRTYDSLHTRRQGYFALKLVFSTNKLSSDFPGLAECLENEKQRWSGKKQKWWSGKKQKGWRSWGFYR